MIKLCGICTLYLGKNGVSPRVRYVDNNNIAVVGVGSCHAPVAPAM